MTEQEKILKMFDKGMLISTISRRLNCNFRYVYAVINNRNMRGKKWVRRTAHKK